MSKNNISIFFLTLLSGCTTYNLSTQSLLEQFANTKTEKKENVVIAFPFFLPFEVTGNDLREIKCLDQNGKEVIIPVTNHTGVRITKKDGSRKTFYFDTLLIKDSTISGRKSHFIGAEIKPISLNEIQIIELQR